MTTDTARGIKAVLAFWGCVAIVLAAAALIFWAMFLFGPGRTILAVGVMFMIAVSVVIYMDEM